MTSVCVCVSVCMGVCFCNRTETHIMLPQLSSHFLRCSLAGSTKLKKKKKPECEWMDGWISVLLRDSGQESPHPTER